MTELRTKSRSEEDLTTADMAAIGDRPQSEPQSPPAAVQPGEAPGDAGKPRVDGVTSAVPLLSEDEAQELRSRWDALQTAFVDDPRSAVEQADQLVAQTIKHLAEGFAGERQQLEQQWSRGDQVSTEDLRIALQRYRSFFSRLLSL